MFVFKQQKDITTAGL